MVALATLSVPELRATLGLSQAKFAQHLGVSRHTVIRAEKGRTIPSRMTQSVIARLARRRGFTSRTIPNANPPFRLSTSTLGNDTFSGG